MSIEYRYNKSRAHIANETFKTISHLKTVTELEKEKKMQQAVFYVYMQFM